MKASTVEYIKGLLEREVDIIAKRNCLCFTEVQTRVHKKGIERDLVNLLTVRTDFIDGVVANGS